MVPPSDSNPTMPTFDMAAFQKDPIAEFTRMSGIFKQMLADSAGIAANFAKASEALGNPVKDRPGSGRLGLGSFSTPVKTAGLGLGLAAIGYMSATPNTMAAVTQRLAADSYAGLSGMSSRQAITGANRLVGLGATSAMGPTMASMNLFYQGGYSAGSKSANTVMGSIAGMSAMTGMSNEAAAASVAGINGMSFLRMGVQARNPDGSLKPISSIINQVYSFLYRGQKITKEQAALVYNPGSKGYQTLSMVANGDAQLLQTLQAGVVARASSGSNSTFSQAMNSGDPNTMLNAMGVDQSSPIRQNFKFQTSQPQVLQATEQGLVGGYNTGLSAASDINGALTTTAGLLGPVNQGLMNLKGILQTMPGAGNAGGVLSGIAGAGMGLAKDYIGYKVFSGAAGAAAKAGPSIMSRVLPWLGRAAVTAAEVAAVVGGPKDHGDTGIGGPDTGGSGISPVNGSLNQNFGGSHKGMDMGVKSGTPVKAHASGVVSFTGQDSSYGNYIELNHGKYKTRYGHLKSILVSKGQRVNKGQIIAKSGSTGNSSGPHLHFEVLVNGKKVNPAPYLSASERGSSSSSVSGLIAGMDSSSLFPNSSRARNTGPNSSFSFISGSLSNTSGLILGTGSQRTWATTLLQRLGKPQTSENIQALTTWAAWEGGQWKNSAHYNPLNTTQGAAGATNMNSTGVKSYQSWDQGYAATIQTLNNGKYKPILSALSAGNNPGAVLNAVNHSPWGTHIPGYGGPADHGDVGTVGASSSRGGGTINLHMKVYIANASVQQAQVLVNEMGKKLKNDNTLKMIGGLL